MELIMKTNLIALLIAVLMLLASPVMALANHTDDGPLSPWSAPQQTPQYGTTFDDPRPQSSCCRGGASPWASESKDAFKSNGRAGYIGSELPPSTGYRPEDLDKYSNPSNRNYREAAGEGLPRR